MKSKTNRNKMVKNRQKSAKKSDECNSDEESFETIKSTDSITVQSTTKTTSIKNSSNKKTSYLRQKKGKLKSLNQKIEAKKTISDEKKRELKNNSQPEVPLVISSSLFGKSKRTAFGRSSIPSCPNSQKPNKTSPGKNVLVPSWRMVSIKPIYKLEGTENLNDEFYLKRHQKHENEERIIKKRDLRRQKEEYLKYKMLNRNRLNPTNKNDKNKLLVINNIDNDLKKGITERKNEEINLDDIEHVLVVDDIEEQTKDENECLQFKVNSPKNINDKTKLKNKNRYSVKQNLENSRSNSKKVPRRKSFPCLPLKPVNDNLNNISVNTNPNSKLNSLTSVYDDLDSNLTDPENSLAPKVVRSNKRKSVLNSSSFANVRLPDKKKTRLSINLL